MQKLPTVVLGVGFTILASALLLGLVIVPGVINKKITEQVRLVEGSETFKRWQEVPIPIHLKLYLFNVTNPEEIITGKRPVLQQIGPYVYQQKRTKVDISINKENDTVTYRQPYTYFFRPELSNGTEQDVISMINLPFIGIASRAAKQSTFIRSAIIQYIEQFEETIFITRTIEQILFKGYHSEMMESLSGVLGYKLLPNDTFGLYYGKNGSDQGEYEVFSGITDSSQFGEIKNWNGAPEMPWWNDEKCKKIIGSDGSTFPPFITTDRVMEIFSADLCRSLILLYDGPTNVRGVPGYRFVTAQSVLDDPRDNPDNMCYCTQPGNNFTNCPKRGAYQINACKKETPLLVSLPHFLDGADEYKNGIIGLDAVRELHQTFIDVEPNSGLLMRASKRIQINIELRPYKFIKQFRKLPSMLFPVVWADEAAEITQAGAERLSSKLITPKSLAQLASWVAFGVGLLIIAIGVIIFLLRARKKNYHT